MDVDARVYMYTAMTLRRGRVISPTLDRVYPLESPKYSFRKRLSEPQDQSGHVRGMENLHPTATRERTLTVQPVAKHLTDIRKHARLAR